MGTQQVAFVPAAGQLDERFLLAVRWIERLEDTTGRRAGLVTPHAGRQGNLVENFKKGRRSTSVKTGGDIGDGPVLVQHTGMDGLIKFASHRPLAYLAWGDEQWLGGWAAALRAIYLTTRQPVDGPADHVAKLLDDLHLAGNNGWFDQPGRRDACRLVSELDQLVSRGYSVGAMLASGHSRDSLRGLQKL